MKLLTLTAVAAVLIPGWAAGQGAAQSAATGLGLDLNFPKFSEQAQKKAEVDLDGASLAKSSDAFAGVKGVHVRHYEFAEAGAYADSDLDPLRRQVAANTDWSRIINVKEKNQSTQIYVLKTDGLPGGLLILAAEAKEVTVVEVLGTVDLGRMQELVKSSISYDLKAAGNAAK